MKVILKAPASCGELIQGIINGEELLISYPVNLYSTAEISFTKNPTSNTKNKVNQAVGILLSKINESKVINRIGIQIKSQIPIGKGMASSTADILAAVKGVAHLVGYPLEENEVANILTSVEPTDSTIFKDVTLFNPRNGEIVQKLGVVPKFSVMVLEGYGTVDTLSFYKKKDKAVGRCSIDTLVDDISVGLKENRVDIIGKAATLSARENQKILFKPYLEDIVEQVAKLKGYGVNIAHSGTVCGVIYGQHFDTEKFIYGLLEKHKRVFKKVYDLQSVPGGAEIV